MTSHITTEVLNRGIPYSMPVGPAIVLSMTIYSSLVITWPLLAAPVAIVLATLFELAGYYVAHNFALQVEAKNYGQSVISGLFLIVFTVSAVGVVLFGHEAIGNDLLVAILAAFPVVSCMVYLSQAMRVGIDDDKAQRQAQQQAEQAQQQAEQAERHHQLALERQREQDEWQQQQDLKRQREEAKIAARYGASQPSKPTVQASPSQPSDSPQQDAKRTKAQRLDAVLIYLETHPHASYAEIGRAVDASKSSGENYAKALITAGRLSKNGHGYEVVK